MQLKRATSIYGLLILVFTLVLLEALLRVIGINDTYMESVGKGYYSYWNKKQDSWYHAGVPNHIYTEKNIDFTYENKINSLGHREREPEEVFNENTGKVIVIGDSYTEGLGVVYDSSFVRHLQHLATADSAALSFYNAGISGNDPVFAFTMIRDKLLRFKPDIVIVTFNHSDYTDIIYRGGFERFKPDSTTEFKSGPWYESFYENCYIFRMLLHVFCGYLPGDLFMTEIDFMQECYKINNLFIAVADSFERISTANNFKMLFVTHPGCPELVYDSEINRRSNQLQAELHEKLKAKGYCSINLWEPMDKVVNEENRLFYGFEHDGHFSSAGYKLMAKTIWEETNKNYKLFDCD